jgi:hypothetical protein
VHADGYLWKIEYEPRVGGAERGLSQSGGTVTAWNPPRHFATRSPDGDGFNQLDFAGRDAVYLSAEAPEASAHGGSAALRRALGVSENVAVGDSVRLTPEGLEPIEGVVYYLTPAFLGVRTADALYRFYGRDVWGWPVGVRRHLFAPGLTSDAKAVGERTWSGWLESVFVAEVAEPVLEGRP